MKSRPLTLIDDTDHLTEYGAAMDRMQEMWEQRVADERPDTLWLLSHEQTFTIGRRTPEAHLPAPETDIPVFTTNRGGQLTYHAPGQLVGYLIVRLQPGEGVVDLIRDVEHRIVTVLADLGIPAERRDTPPGSELLTGVWTRDTGRKITSIGMRVGRNVSTHGFALNVTGDLAPWKLAVACGLPDVDMTSVERELDGGQSPTLAQVAATAARVFEAKPAQ
ncbi:lipoyl(octanoyl) transferase LipB [Nocardia seriolae]|uniref:Octanoyltransferase n=1 Tax=Nocardia seriolae TaxID=37332 RepID=A0ABC8AU55_9NOCA|nr:lipoyl(octanoyl) transferase LipB [Nocardia seriolae]APA97674.1 Lipoyl(octanoyl) transferase [Nocardia seriolae]WKY50222.1 lipoyl(octanoyl) transferase LipB [Nocardia seriolae]WNJ61793.1 lipoyl(octanoyl) transferase LipB [Nocardia seriolae]BAW05955.1 octanoyltransferase [Nocardia seriolae]BEK87278.1 lipoyl(octanoyl) transferase LipB [Nocardia seriolae]